MADQKGTFTIANVGVPPETVTTKYGQMVKYKVQFDGDPSWYEIMQKQETDAPKQGDQLTGEKYEDPKWGMKFKKENKSGGFGGGRGYSKGAIWSNAVQTAATVVGEYVKANPNAQKDINSIDDYLNRIEAVAPKMKEMVDRLTGADTSSSNDNNDTNTEAGESPAPAPQQTASDGNASTNDVNESDLGDW